MNLSKLIASLQEKLEKHGDIEILAWQHPEENDGYREPISSLYFDETTNKLTIS